MVWAKSDWVEPSERRRGMIASFRIIAMLLPGLFFFAIGVFKWFQGKDSVKDSVIIAAAGLLLLLAAVLSAKAIHPYRWKPAIDAGATVFHISPASWEIGQHVVLEVSRSRSKQELAECWRFRRAKVVYFFPQHPTHRHARGQVLAPRRCAPRYLYELKLELPIDEVYVREAACATPNDVAVIVRSRHPLGKT